MRGRSKRTTKKGIGDGERGDEEIKMMNEENRKTLIRSDDCRL